MTLLQKIVVLYRSADGSISRYYQMDGEFLDKVIYELAEFLEKRIKDPDMLLFRKVARKAARKEGVKWLKAAWKDIEKAKTKQGIFKKMECFDRAKHYLHKMHVFKGELGEISAELKRRHRQGWK